MLPEAGLEVVENEDDDGIEVLAVSSILEPVVVID